MFQSVSFTRVLFAVALILALAGAYTFEIPAQGAEDGELDHRDPAAIARDAVYEEEIPPEGQPEGIGTDGEPESQLESLAAVVEEEVDQPGAPNAMLFMRLAANTFIPLDNTNTWAYTNGGCFYHTGGSRLWDKDIQLPQGAEIDYLRIYFYDENDFDNASVSLLRFDSTGNETIIAQAEGSGTPGYSSAGIGNFSEIVDNTAYSYSLRISFDYATVSTLQICAVRIRYQYSFFATTLPLVIRP